MTYYPSIFKKKEYDEKIDFIKGLSILFVILNHCVEDLQAILFPLWGSPAVTLFILIQVFHVYKKETTSPKIAYRTIWTRILKPFIAVQIILVAFWILFSDLSITEQLKLIAYKGGKGPGSYYIWIYLQIALLLPFLGLIR